MVLTTVSEKMRIWKKGHDRRSVHSLCGDALRVIGALHECDASSVGSIAKVLAIEEDRVRFLLAEITRSRNKIIKILLKNGLPATVYVDLADNAKAKCLRCHQLMSRLPCQRCSIDDGRLATHWDERERNKTPPKPTKSVRFAPGTVHKIEAMRQRLLAGQQLFHKDDLTWEDERSTGEFLF